MTPYETRLLELLDTLEAAISDLREHVKAGHDAAPEQREAVEAFADEAFRARDA